MKEPVICARCGYITASPVFLKGEPYCSFCHKVISLGIETTTLEKKLNIMFPYKSRKKVVRK